MFQTYDDPGGPALGRKHLPRLRKALKAAGLDGFIVPHEDEWQNEYVPPAYDRLAWTTGFTGSAGAAVVLADEAAVFVDGRYTLQVRAQVDGALFAYRDLVDGGVPAYLRERAPKGAKIGYDPKLHSPDSLDRIRAAADAAGAELVPVTQNPIDTIWDDRPPIPMAKVEPHAETYSGESAASKRQRLGEGLSKEGADAVVLTSPASLAWLFNIRGGDVARTPLPLGEALLRADGTADLFIADEKVSPELKQWLGNQVAVKPSNELQPTLAALGGKKVKLDPSSASAWYFEELKSAGAEIVRGQDPVVLPRACKNAAEVEGSRQAHIRDGAAVSRYLHWLATDGQTGKVQEIEACERLEAFRADTGALKDLSFDSISGAGPNGAIVHYRVTKKTNRKLGRGSLFLIDSGGQYLDGTTDITRTVAIGRPTKEMKDRFTRVLKGHIALARVRFPKGTTGHQLDALARMSLWEAGLDYDHGTGHGVGVYLGVHEGPHRIAKFVNTQPLEPGMIVSNEPGYYKTGAYGIRIENLQVVTPAADIDGGERPMLGFETLTLAPIARELIVKQMLTKEELAWLNAYHATVWEKIGPQLDGEAKAWLEAATKPL
ncbi:aminopeptidase P family protein [Vitreimonas flagellata]|uniref:aminopeptidase P family protein n=1 Tax=Vitreimonas flagellata TaxID=2560861 RepID=UPI001075816B|nr:aminopeptidase P family protein [Vitreimonas flagellata]